MLHGGRKMNLKFKRFKSFGAIEILLPSCWLSLRVFFVENRFDSPLYPRKAFYLLSSNTNQISQGKEILPIYLKKFQLRSQMKHEKMFRNDEKYDFLIPIKLSFNSSPNILLYSLILFVTPGLCFS